MSSSLAWGKRKAGFSPRFHTAASTTPNAASRACHQQYIPQQQAILKHSRPALELPSTSDVAAVAEADTAPALTRRGAHAAVMWSMMRRLAGRGVQGAGRLDLVGGAGWGFGYGAACAADMATSAVARRWLLPPLPASYPYWPAPGMKLTNYLGTCSRSRDHMP